MKIARETLKKNGLTNVVFRKGSSVHIPLVNQSADIVVAVTSASFYNAENIERFVSEAERVLVNDGSIYSLDIAPCWYEGDLTPVILGPSKRQIGTDIAVIRDEAFTSLGFTNKDFYSYQEFDSQEHIISTYGFIFGKKAIEYLKAHNKTTIKWESRIYSKTLMN